MIFSTVKRNVGLGIVSSLIICSGVVYLSDTSFKIASEQPLDVTPTLDAPDGTLALNDETLALNDGTLALNEDVEAPVLQLASLSVMTDYPSIDLSNTSTEPLTTDDRLLRARALAEVQRYEEALDILETIETSDKNDYAVSFLKAKILSWAGKHYEAEKIFKPLRRQYPKDADVAVSYAYLHLYQSKFNEAERLFSKVIDEHPEYMDAQNGLKRALDAKAR